MTHGRFKKFWNLLRLYLVIRELKRRPKTPLGPLAFAVLLLVGCSYVGAPVADPVSVVMRDGLPACSAFAVAKDKVVTAAHCVTGNAAEVVTETQWRLTTNASTPATVEYLDPARDLAVLTGEFNFTSPISLRPPTTEAIYSRSVLFDAIADGNVLAGAGAFRQTTLSVEFGWSGSPVFGLDGKVVGFVHSCRARKGQCLPFETQIGVLP
jgi:S1-C subfamily serine protease